MSWSKKELQIYFIISNIILLSGCTLVTSFNEYQFDPHGNNGDGGSLSDSDIDDIDSDKEVDADGIIQLEPPVAHAGLDREIMSTRTIYLDGGKSSDPQDASLTYNWTQLDGNIVNIGEPKSVVATVIAPSVPDVLTFRLEVCNVEHCRTDDVVITVHRWNKIAAGSSHIAALRSDGTVWSFGDEQFGVLGIRNRNGGNHASYPHKVVKLNKVVDIWATSQTTYAKKSSGAIYSWGINCYEESGYIVASHCDTVDEPRRVTSQFENNISYITGGYDYALYLYGNNVLKGLGSAYGGALGTCPVTNTPFYMSNVFTVPGSWKMVSTSPNSGSASSYPFTLAIASDQTLVSWGRNNNGQLGNSNFSSTCFTPQEIEPRGNWEAISAGRYHSLGIREGRLYAWGLNEEGESGEDSYCSPNGRGNQNDWLSVSGGYNFSLALRKNGQLFSWGENSSGQLGLGDQKKRLISGDQEPYQIGNDTNWSQIEALLYNAAALKDNGSLWTWGRKSYVLGLGTVEMSGHVLRPTQVVDGPLYCGDGMRAIAQSEDRHIKEECDDGALNGNQGYCSASCRCADTRVVYVNANATGENDGSDWENAYTTIDAAIDSMGICDTIWVAKGRYRASGDRDVPVLAMIPGTEIYGGFAGNETHFSQRKLNKDNMTILDGEGTQYHVVTGANLSTLDGFGVTGGNAVGEDEHKNGGGMLINDSGTDPIIVRNVVFFSNNSLNEGGALYQSGSNRPLIIENSVFVLNSALSGGAIWYGGADLLLQNSRFYNNSATSPNALGGRGGAVYGSSESLCRLTNLQFVDNSASNQGGAIFIDSQARLDFITVANTKGRAHESVYVGSAGTRLANSVLWNPDMAQELSLNQGRIVGSCGSGFDRGAGVALTSSPFNVVGQNEDARYFLSANSPCLDIGDADAAFVSLKNFEQMSVLASGKLDTGLPDAGFHW